MRHEDNPKSIKYHVKQFILANRRNFEGSVVIDAPAGSGSTSRILQGVGAQVHAYDLFPEYFKVEGLTCHRANIMEGLPVADGFADNVICQEGIEHFSDQYGVLQEFNRVLKQGGSLIITTPNYSNLQQRLSYFLFETEYAPKRMPPNEINSIWMADESMTNEIYFGHVFLIGIQKLRFLATLSGFEIKRIVFVAASNTSLIMLPFAYPFILLTNWWTWCYRRMRKDKGVWSPARQQLYRELMKLNADVRLLVDKELFVEFVKKDSLETVRRRLRTNHKTFDVIT